MSLKKAPERRIPAGLIGMLVVLAVLEIGLFRRARFTTTQAESWRFNARWAVEKSREADILVFGDSLMEFGVIPQVFQQRTGLRTINLAAHDGGVALAYVLLRRSLESGARPRAVLVDFLPHQLAKGAADPSFARCWATFVSPSEALDLAANARDPSFFARSIVGRVLGSFAARYEVRAAISAAFQGEDYSPREKVFALRRHWEANLGAQVIEARPREPVERFEDLFPNAWQLDPETEKYVRMFLDLAESRGIPVFWTIPPIRSDAQRWRDSRGLDQPYDEFVESLTNQYSGLSIVDGRSRGYGDELFLDHVHLNRDGAEAFSRSLAETVVAPQSVGLVVRLDPPDPTQPRTPGIVSMHVTRRIGSQSGNETTRR